MLKIGLIGAGYMGSMHATCYKALSSESVTIAAVADLREEKAKDVAEKFGAKVYRTGMELIEDADVDAIDICLPTYLHTEHAVSAMKKGYPVFIEKPLCLKVEEIELLMKTKEETQVPVMVGQCIRFWSEYEWLKGIIEEGKYGKVISAVFKRLSSGPTWAWKDWLNKTEYSGTVAMDMHIHDVDFVRYILGEPEEVSAVASRDEDGVIQQIFSTFQYDNGKNTKDSVVTVEACWDYPDAFPFTTEYRVKFEKATIVNSTESTPSLVIYPNDGGKIVPELEKEFEGESDLGGNVSSLGGYYNELKYFVNGLNNNTPLTVSPLEDAAKSVQLIHKVIDSSGGAKLQ